jgi:DNA repair protein RadC
MNMYAIRSALSEALRLKEGSPVMQELFTHYVTPYELLDASVEELRTIKGVTHAKARTIASTLKLARALNTPRENPHIIRSPKDAFDLMRFEIGHLMHEEFWIIILNTKNHVVATEKISQGTLDTAIVHPRECLLPLIRRAASSWIALHNHPSSDCSPSDPDVQLTKRLVDASEIVGIPLLDHLVISTDSYYSLKENGLM